MVVFFERWEEFEERHCRGQVTAELSATFGLEREDRVTAKRMPAGSGRPLVAPEVATTRNKGGSKFSRAECDGCEYRSSTHGTSTAYAIRKNGDVLA